eukprot:1184038-Prorocentrum_minimum.AAC.6
MARRQLVRPTLHHHHVVTWGVRLQSWGLGNKPLFRRVTVGPRFPTPSELSMYANKGITLALFHAHRGAGDRSHAWRSSQWVLEDRWGSVRDSVEKYHEPTLNHVPCELNTSGCACTAHVIPTGVYPGRSLSDVCARLKQSNAFTSLSLLIHRTEVLFHSTHAKKILVLGPRGWTTRKFPVSHRLPYTAPTSANSAQDDHPSRVDDNVTLVTPSPVIPIISVTARSAVTPSSLILTDSNRTLADVLPDEGEQHTTGNFTNQVSAQAGQEDQLVDTTEDSVDVTGVTAELLTGESAHLEVHVSTEGGYPSNDSDKTSDEVSPPIRTDVMTLPSTINNLTNATGMVFSRDEG